MPEDLVGRIAQDVADGKPVDWAAALSAAASPAERKQVESLRMVHGLGRMEPAREDASLDSTITVNPNSRFHQPTADGPRWGRYLLLEEAGSGGFGRVYRANDPALDLDVAIKVLHRHVNDQLLRERLLTEGRALARIRHQNVVRVLGIEFSGDRVGLCTEFVHGETLERELRTHGTFSEAEVIQIGKAVCQALSAVHHAGFLHRDVKARNVMRERDTGRIVLMDFGTGRELADELASDGLGLEGTVIYMAPEILAGHHASHATDVYSVGVLLYYLLTGKYPVEGQTFAEIKAAHTRGNRTPLVDRRPDLSPGFAQVVERALSPPAKRYATPSVLGAELDIVDTKPAAWVRRLRTAAIVALSIVGVVIALGFVNTFYVNVALGRGGFANEGIADWLTWGMKSIVAPVVVAALTLLGTTIALESVRLVVRHSSRARAVQKSIAARIHKHSLNNVEALASLSLLSSASILFATWWYFAPLLGTLTTNIFPDISTVPLQRLALLSPDYGEYHLAYRKAFLTTTIACVMLWYPTVRLAMRTRQRIPQRTAIAGAIVLGLSLLLLNFPYRLLSHDIDFEEVSWNGRSCHVLGARGNERLIFCADLPVPRNRPVPASDVVPHPAPALTSDDAPGGVVAKRKRSIFKFLLQPQDSRGAQSPGS